MSKSMINMFYQRTQMNVECQLVYKELKMQHNMDIIILTANTKEDNEVPNEWQGFVQTLKTFIIGENKMLIDQIQVATEKREAQEKEMKGEITEINQKMEHMQEDISGLKGMIQSLIDQNNAITKSS